MPVSSAKAPRAINIGGTDAPEGPAADAQPASGERTIYVDGKAVQARHVAVSERKTRAAKGFPSGGVWCSTGTW